MTTTASSTLTTHEREVFVANGTMKAVEALRRFVAQGTDPATLTASTAELSVCYNTEAHGVSVQIERQVWVKAAQQRTRYLLHRAVVVDLDTSGTVDMIRDLTVAAMGAAMAEADGVTK